MKTTRRGLFRLILALPFAPKCVQAFRPKPRVFQSAFQMARLIHLQKHMVSARFINMVEAPGTMRKIGDTISVRKPVRFRV